MVLIQVANVLFTEQACEDGADADSGEGENGQVELDEDCSDADRIEDNSHIVATMGRSCEKGRSCGRGQGCVRGRGRERG